MPRPPRRPPRRWSNVRVTSTPALAAAVQNLTAAGSKTLTPETYFVGRQYTRVCIDNLLRDLGKYTSPPHVALTPFHIADQWAWLRYRWAFHTPLADLVPTAQAMGLTHHHSTTFSEHVGITFGLDAARKALKNRHPGADVRFFDVDFALAGLYRGLPGLTVGRNRPDYLARVVTGGTALYYVVECKGRRYSDNRAMHLQMAKGAMQVQSLRIGGQSVPSLIVATTANTASITVAILDPEDEGVQYELPERVTPTAPLLIKESRGPSVDLGLFAQRMEAVVVADILLEAGDFVLAGELLQQSLPIDRAGVESITVNNLPSIGQLVSFPMPGGVLHAFRGVAQESLAGAREGLSAPTSLMLEGSPDNDVPEDQRTEGDPTAEDVVADHDDSGFAIAVWSD